MKRLAAILLLGALPGLGGCIIVSLGGNSIFDDEEGFLGFLLALGGYGMTRNCDQQPNGDVLTGLLRLRHRRRVGVHLDLQRTVRSPAARPRRPGDRPGSGGLR
jgi:hypothetical protein